MSLNSSLGPEVQVDGNTVIIRIKVGKETSASMLAKKLKDKTGLEFSSLGDSVVSVVTIDKSFMDDDFIKVLTDRVSSMLNIDLGSLVKESKKPVVKRRKRRSKRGKRSRGKKRGAKRRKNS